MAQIAGPELGYVTDAVERVTLYAGRGAAVTEEAVSEVVVKVREASVFALVDAVGRRDRGKALAALADVYDPRDRGLPLLGLLAWSVRQLVKFEAATRAGARPEDAAKAAGAPPFKARDLAAQIQKLPAAELERWLLLLAEADLALKGSKRTPAAVLETLVLSMAAS
jgi:DNA polymerase-3 subunit delta